MVEVFKTNVSELAQANNIVALLHVHYPNSRINFDLDDCDRILRIESDSFHADKIARFVHDRGFECSILE